MVEREFYLFFNDSVLGMTDSIFLPSNLNMSYFPI